MNTLARPHFGHRHAHAAPARAPHGFGLGAIWNRLSLMWRVHTERRSLRELDDHLLRDLGISRTTLELEAGRPLWDTAGCRRTPRSRPLPDRT